MKKNVLIGILCLTFFAGCKKGEIGAIGPKGDAGAAGVAGKDNNTVGVVGDKGLTGDKGATGATGAVGDNGVVSNVFATDWKKLNNWAFVEQFDPKDGLDFFDVLFNASIDVPQLTAESLSKDIVINYAKYVDEFGVTRITQAENSFYFPNFPKDIQLTRFGGNKVGKSYLQNLSFRYFSKNLNEFNTSEISKLNQAGVELRVVIIPAVIKGRMASIDFSNYEQVCSTFNIKK